jgi:glycerol uptake facilitator-like aquaporin
MMTIYPVKYDPEVEHRLFLTEMICSAVFAALSLNLYKGRNNSILNGLAYALAFMGLSELTVKISRGCFNPAINGIQLLMQKMLQFINGNIEYENKTSLKNIMVYLFAPVLGGLIASVFMTINEGAGKMMIKAESQIKVEL